MQKYEFKVSKVRKVLMTTTVIPTFWFAFFYIAKGYNLLWFPIPLTISYLFYQLVADLTFEISGEYLFLKSWSQTKKIHAKDLLDFSFSHSVDAESGFTWHFAINTVSKDFYCASPISLDECLRFANVLIKFFEKYKPSTWTGTVTSKNDILSCNENGLTINNIPAIKIDFRRGGIVDPVVLTDKNHQEYTLDLTPNMRDFYIFKSYFDKKIELQFSFKTY